MVPLEHQKASFTLIALLRLCFKILRKSRNVFVSYKQKTTITIYHKHVLLNRKKPAPGLKMLFINYMINSGGNLMLLSSTVNQLTIFVISDFHDDELLKAIDKVKVR